MTELYRPSLIDGKYEKTKSFEINRLILVALIGGIIPLVVLGVKTGKWLRVDKKILNLFILLGGIALLLELVAVSLLNKWPSGQQYVSIVSDISRIVAILLYVFYYVKIKMYYRQHIITSNKMMPIFGHALIWVAVGILWEIISGALIASLGGSI